MRSEINDLERETRVMKKKGKKNRIEEIHYTKKGKNAKIIKDLSKNRNLRKIQIRKRRRKIPILFLPHLITKPTEFILHQHDSIAEIE